MDDGRIDALNNEGKKLMLNIPDIRPVTNMVISYKIKAADGTAINQEIDNTINVVP